MEIWLRRDLIDICGNLDLNWNIILVGDYVLKEENCCRELSHKCVILDGKEMPLKNFIQIRDSKLGVVWHLIVPFNL